MRKVFIEQLTPEVLKKLDITEFRYVGEISRCEKPGDIATSYSSSSKLCILLDELCELHSIANELQGYDRTSFLDIVTRINNYYNIEKEHKMITAQEAKEQTEQLIMKEETETLYQIEEQIKQAIQNKEFSIQLPNIEENIKIRLESLGYSVDYNDIKKNKSGKISWK